MTAKEVLDIARGELGYKENPPDSNMTKYGKWFGLNGQPWCMMFVMWCFKQAGYYDALPVHTASCTTMMNSAKAKNMWVTSGFKPGDILIMSFNGSRHVGIVESANPSAVITIEGNTGSGNEANGGQVMKRTRRYSNILGAVRLNYEEEEEMSYEQFEKYMDRYNTEKAKKSPSSVSAEARAWAEKNGIIQGDANGNHQYKSFCTREHVVLFLYRFAKLIGKA